MPGLDNVLERLVSEPDVRDELTRDPKTALAGVGPSPFDSEGPVTEGDEVGIILPNEGDELAIELLDDGPDGRVGRAG